MAIDSTRIKASASPDQMEQLEWARTRRQVRWWQQACAAEDPNEGAGNGVEEALAKLDQVKVPRIPPAQSSEALAHRQGKSEGLPRNQVELRSTDS